MGISDQYKNANSVLLPLIRNVMPNVIAHDIAGVQPMTGPTGSLFKMRKRYQRIFDSITPKRHGYRMSKEQLRNFLRVNNRRKTHTIEEMRAYGYPSIEITNLLWKQAIDWENWLDENMPNQYFYAGETDLFFSEEQYKIMYLLRWS